MFSPHKTLQSTNKPSLPEIKVSNKMKYVRNFHKNKSTMRINAHTKVLHNSTNRTRRDSPNGRSIDSANVLDQIRALVQKTSKAHNEFKRPTIEKSHTVDTVSLKTLYLDFKLQRNAQNTIYEVRNKKERKNVHSMLKLA